MSASETTRMPPTRTRRTPQRARAAIWDDLSPGVAIMLVGYMHLLVLDPGDGDEDLGITYMLLGAELYKQQLEDELEEEEEVGRRRRGPYIKNRTQEFIDNLIEIATDRFFKSWFRVNRETFFALVELIKDDPVFAYRDRRPQSPPKYQLAVYLIRYGNLPTVKTATMVQMSEGSMYNHSRRVVRAFRNLCDLYVKWPDKREQREIRRKSQSQGFPGAVGAVDGSYIPILDRPRRNPMTFRCRKKFWAWNIQIVVNFEGEIMSYDCGWPGCTADRTVLRNSDLWLNREEYLGPHEYILADGGYFISQWFVMPYDESEYGAERQIKRQWNKAHSSLRIAVEHTFGRLKMRFPYLTGIRGRNLKEMLRVIESLFVVHNILIRLGDLPEGMHDLDLNAILREQNLEYGQNPINQAANARAARTDGPEETRVRGRKRRELLLERWKTFKGIA